MTQVYLGLGSNLGDSTRVLNEAAGRLRSLSRGGFAASSLWVTAAVGFSEPVPDFLNAVVRIEWHGQPALLLSEIQAIERDFGRVRSSETTGYASRTLDVDIIDFGGLQLNEPSLTLPHARAHMRLFVLEPLRELDREFQFPGMSENLDDLIRSADQVETRRISPMNPSG